MVMYNVHVYFETSFVEIRTVKKILSVLMKDYQYAFIYSEIVGHLALVVE